MHNIPASESQLFSYHPIFDGRPPLGFTLQVAPDAAKDGKLDKHGKPNEKTPTDFLKSYKDFSKSKPPALFR